MDITFSGTLTNQDYAQAMGMYRSDGSKIQNTSAHFFLLAVAILFGVGIGQNPTRLIILIPMIIVSASLLFLSRKVSSGTDQEVWEKSTNMHELQNGIITSKGIQANCPTCESQQIWAHYKYYLATDHLILLYVSPYLFNIYPRSFFSSEEEWSTFATYVQLYVPGEKPAIWDSSLAPQLAFINTLYTLILFIGTALLFSL